jgi:aminoglycoside phosphotransferase (APT) family kinase protein
MKVYDAQVRLAGNMLQTVPRYRITEREIRLLRTIHGADAVTDIKEVGDTDASEESILNELAGRYSKKRVEQIFNVSLDNFEQWLDEQLEQSAKPQVILESPGIAPLPMQGAEESAVATRKPARNATQLV